MKRNRTKAGVLSPLANPNLPLGSAQAAAAAGGAGSNAPVSDQNAVKAQLIVKVLIFMITDDYAVVQRLDDMESWQYVEQFRHLTPALW